MNLARKLLIIGLVPLAFMFLHVVVAALSVFAISDLLGGNFFSFIGALLFAIFIPQLTGIVAIYASIVEWGWPWYGAVLVFMWPMVLTALAYFGIITVGGMGAYGAYKRFNGGRFTEGGNDNGHGNRHAINKDTIEGDYKTLDD